MKEVANKKGFTLVELIIVISLLGITLSAIYTFFYFAQDSFSKSERQTKLLQEMNLAKDLISRDIRAASRPNTATQAVVITAAGQQMDIYTYDSGSDKYSCISYRLSSEDKTILQRGTVKCTSTNPPASANPSYGVISSWKTVLTGVAYEDADDNSISLFTDITTPVDSERRRISLNISTNDLSKPLTTPVELKMNVTSRSEGVY